MNRKIPVPEVGEKIEIHYKNNEYKSQILDFTKNNIIVSGPIHKNSIVPIHKDKIITIMYTLENRGRYWFKAKVISNSLDNIYKLVIKRINDIKREQEREYYRLNKVIDIKILIEDEIIKGLSEDISGNGLKLLSNKKFEENQTFDICFSLLDNNLSIKGKIVRSEISIDKSYNYIYGIEFVGIDKSTRDNIIKFIFNEQRKLRKKGLR